METTPAPSNIQFQKKEEKNEQTQSQKSWIPKENFKEKEKKKSMK